MTRAERDARVAALREQCQLLSNQRARLEDLNEREDAAPWIGRCFRYRNRDSNGRSWPVYYRVLRHDGGNTFIALKVQSQPDGWHIVEAKERLYLLPDPKQRGLVEVPRREFDAALNAFARRVVALNSDGKRLARRARFAG